jgi:hypothetical protein
VVGSPRGRRSTSESLGSYLLGRLAPEGFEPRTVRPGAPGPEGRTDLAAEASAADLVILSLPLYWDSLPAPLIRALEALRDARTAPQTPDNPRLVALVNSGFPEAAQSEVALGICRCFAKQSGFRWAGGLALPGGAALDGKPLDELGVMARRIRRALDAAGDALAAGGDIPERAVELMARPVVSPILYRLTGTLGWLLQARRHGTWTRLGSRPYER